MHLSCGFPQGNPPQRQLRPRNSRPLSSQLRPRSIRQHQCSTSTSCRCRSSSTAHLPPSWRSQTTRKKSLPLRRPMISSTLLHPTNLKMQLPNPYAQQRSPAPQAYCLLQSRTRCPGRILGLLAFSQDLEAQLHCLVPTQGRTFCFFILLMNVQLQWEVHMLSSARHPRICGRRTTHITQAWEGSLPEL